MANLTDKLLKMDKATISELPTGEMKARHLSNLMGEDVMVKLRAINGERYTELSMGLMDEDGNPDFTKSYDLSALMVLEGLQEPNPRDKELMEHFGCKTPKELVKLLFPGGDLVDIAGKITEL